MKQPIKSNQSTFLVISKVWSLLLPERKQQVLRLVVLMIMSGISELISLGAVIPFLLAISDLDAARENHFIKFAANTLGIETNTGILLLLTILFCVAAIGVSIIRLSNLWANGRVAAAIGTDLSVSAYKNILNLGYASHTNQNSSTFVNAISHQTTRTVLGLSAVLQMCTAAVVSASLLIGLLAIQWKAAIVSIVIFGTTYYILSRTNKQELSSNSFNYARASKLQLKSLQEGLGAVRDIKLSKRQSYFIEEFERIDTLQRRMLAKNQFLAGFPRYTLESVGMLSLALIGFWLVINSSGGNISSILPVLGALGLGAQRLLPSLQQLYSGWAQVNSCKSDIEAILFMINQRSEKFCETNSPLDFHESIKLDQVGFKSSSGGTILKNISLKINKGECLGLIGKTGCGKSTLIDIVMGLIAPSDGVLIIDNTHCLADSEELMKWRSCVAHVSQSIFLQDGSFAQNIALGLPIERIDMEKVKYASNIACIDTYIESHPEGYDRIIGEKGVKLSGGQRQRVAIARAIYLERQLLVLDEATSALDQQTEANVVEQIKKLSPKTTLIIVAHRLSTLRYCDRILEIQDGSLALETTPSKLLLGGQDAVTLHRDN